MGLNLLYNYAMGMGMYECMKVPLMCLFWVFTFLQHPKLLVAALSTNPEFLRNKQSDNNLVVDYKDWQIPLGRRFRSGHLIHCFHCTSFTNIVFILTH